MATTYKDSGVNIEAGYDAVKLIKERCESTFDENVLTSLGGFGGCYALPGGLSEPVLVSGTDGVGTKLRLAMVLDKHDTIGQDCVAMCVNDIVCQGARPLFFLDYLAVGKLIPERAAEIVKGVSDGCLLAGCALIGGETAEMPGFYGEDEYDLAGFAVGLAEKANIIDNTKVAEGDVLIGLESSGVHSNGFSLVRKIFPPTQSLLKQYTAELGRTLGETLLEPTKVYVKPALQCIDAADVHGMAHITGGGFYENVPRIIPDGLCARIDRSSWPEQAIFRLISAKGGVERKEMYNVYNMGIGMVLSVSKGTAQAALDALKAAGETAYVIGEVARDSARKIELLA